MTRVCLAGMTVLVLALAGCGGSSHATRSPGPPGTIHVVMKNIAYNPPVIRAKVGDTVTWTNRDDAPHNVTYAAGPRFNSSATFTQGVSWTLVLRKPGVIHYLCTIHPGMVGVIIVRR